MTAAEYKLLCLFINKHVVLTKGQILVAMGLRQELYRQSYPYGLYASANMKIEDNQVNHKCSLFEVWDINGILSGEVQNRDT